MTLLPPLIICGRKTQTLVRRIDLMKNPLSLNAENMNNIMYCIRKMPVYYFFICTFTTIKRLFVNYFASEGNPFNPLGYNLQRRHNNKGSSFDLENC